MNLIYYYNVEVDISITSLYMDLEFKVFDQTTVVKDNELSLSKCVKL